MSEGTADLVGGEGEVNEGRRRFLIGATAVVGGLFGPLLATYRGIFFAMLSLFVYEKVVIVFPSREIPTMRPIALLPIAEMQSERRTCITRWK